MNKAESKGKKKKNPLGVIVLELRDCYPLLVEDAEKHLRSTKRQGEHIIREYLRQQQTPTETQ